MIRDLIEVLKKGNRDPSSYGRFMERRDEMPGAPWVLLPDDVDEGAIAGHPTP